MVATQISSGRRLWPLTVYPTPIDQKLEPDARWHFIAAMGFDPDGRLWLGNGADGTLCV